MNKITVNINAPVMNKTTGSFLSTEGQIEITYECSENLESAILKAKNEVNEALASLKAENEVVTSIKQAESILHEKESLMRDLNRKYEKAQKIYEKLMAFLGRLGVDGAQYCENNEFTISNQAILEGETIDTEDEE